MTTALLADVSHEELAALHTALTLEYLRERLEPGAFEALTTPCSLWRSSEVGLPLVHAVSCEEFCEGEPVRTSTFVEFFTEWAECGMRVHDCLPAGLELWELWSRGSRESASISDLRGEATELVRTREAILQRRPLPSLFDLVERIERPRLGAPPALLELRAEVTSTLTDALASLSVEEVASLLPSLSGYETEARIPRGSGRSLQGPYSVVIAGGLPGTLLRLWAGGTRHREDLALLVLPTREAELVCAEMERVNRALAPRAPLPVLAGSWDWANATAARLLILESFIEATEYSGWSEDADRRSLAGAVQLAAEVFTT